MPVPSPIEPDQPQQGSSASPETDAKASRAVAAPTSPTILKQLLQPFQEDALPERSRVDVHVKQREHSGMTVGKLWQYLPFLGAQASTIVSSFVSHHVNGPPKPSWGIEMTIFTAVLRASVNYSHLSSIQRLRHLLNLGNILPTPKDGIVTPVTFAVKKRGLTGFLAESDRAEDGKRELTGEWVIHKRLWRKLQADHQAAGRKGDPSKKAPQVGREKVILYLHGGAYYVMSAATHRFLTISVSSYTGCRIFAVNYRLAPETRFPGALHDAVASYFRLIYDLKIPPENIIFAGDSAGGGLCVATMLYLRDNKYPLPSGAILMSPWVDLTMSCESWDSNKAYDYLPAPKSDDHLNPVRCYLGDEGIKKYIHHPYASPLFGDFTGLPPMLIQGGDAEVLRDEGTLLAHKASVAGCLVEHELYADMPHVHVAFIFLEASRQSLRSQRRFVRHVIPSVQTGKTMDHTKMDSEIVSDAHVVKEDGQAEAARVQPDTVPTDDEGERDQSEDSDSRSATPPPPEQGHAEDGTKDGDAASSGAATGALKATKALADTAIGASSDRQADRESPRRSDDPPAHTSGNGKRAPPPSLHGRLPSLDTSTMQSLIMSKSQPGTPADLTDATASSPSTRRRHRSTTAVSPGIFRSSGHGNYEPLPTPKINARQSSHPDLKALLESYEASGPAQHTTMFVTNEGDRSDKAKEDDYYFSRT